MLRNLLIYRHTHVLMYTQTPNVQTSLSVEDGVYATETSLNFSVFVWLSELCIFLLFISSAYSQGACVVHVPRKTPVCSATSDDLGGLLIL